MRKLFASQMLSIDGYYEGINHDINWHSVDQEFNARSIEMLSSVDTLVFGRVTYELMASYWPTQAGLEDDPVIAGFMNRIPKLVFSRTLTKLDWENSHLGMGNLGEEITRLKNHPGKDIAIFGSGNLVTQLAALGLIDEYQLIFSPIALGGGSSLFAGLSNSIHLKLISSQAYHNGNVELRYQPD